MGIFIILVAECNHPELVPIAKAILASKNKNKMESIGILNAGV